MAFFKPRLILRRGTRAAQPDAADPLVAEGTLYAVTDESVVERSNGSAWESFSASGGDVFGPGSGTVDNSLVRWDGTLGTLVQGSDVLLDDSGNLSGITNLTMSGQLLVSGSSNPLFTLTSTDSGTAPKVQFYNVSGDAWHLGLFGNLDRFAFTRTAVADLMQFVNDTTPKRLQLDQGATGYNVLIGNAVGPTTGTLGLIFGDGTALATMATNTAGLYANDVAGTVEMFAIDEAGTATQISPHNFTLFEPPAGHVFPWSYYSKNPYLGVEIGVNIARLVELVEQLTGETLLFERPLPAHEVRDWADDQEANAEKHLQELDAWEQTRSSVRPPPDPEVKDPPEWLANRLRAAGRLAPERMTALRQQVAAAKAARRGLRG